MTTTDLQTALYNAHNRTVTYKRHKYKLKAEFRDIIYPCKRTEFDCHAIDLTPTNEHERKFCLWDLWRSESEDSQAILFKFAKLGGYKTA